MWIAVFYFTQTRGMWSVDLLILETDFVETKPSGNSRIFVYFVSRREYKVLCWVLKERSSGYLCVREVYRWYVGFGWTRSLFKLRQSGSTLRTRIKD